MIAILEVETPLEAFGHASFVVGGGTKSRREQCQGAVRGSGLRVASNVCAIDWMSRSQTSTLQQE